LKTKADDEAIALEGIHNEFISDELDSKAMKGSIAFVDPS